MNQIYTILLSLLLPGVLFSQSFLLASDSDNLIGKLYNHNISNNSSFLNSIDSVTAVVSGDNVEIPKWYDMFTNIPGDYLRFSKQTFTTDNIPAILGIAAATAGLIAADNITYKYQHEKIYASNDFSRKSSDLFTELGDGRTQFSLAAAFAAYGFIGKDARALRTASQIVQAVLSAGTVVQVLKHTTGRESPVVSTSPTGIWKFFPSILDYHKKIPAFDAYPSGHVATSLAAFTVIAENYPEYKWIRPVSYSVVALIGFSMVNRGEHWYSDYPLGIVLGYSFGRLAAHSEKKHQDQNSPKFTYSLTPYLGSLGTGVSFSANF
ncbi:MAG: phosphatase PAP2 family protein [Bacillota bacterium]